jgi:hypothetical protein
MAKKSNVLRVLRQITPTDFVIKSVWLDAKNTEIKSCIYEVDALNSLCNCAFYRNKTVACTEVCKHVKFVQNLYPVTLSKPKFSCIY